MKQNKIKVALTGGIGSGKSTVLKIIDKEGYKTFSCDSIYCELLNNSDFLNMLVFEFGDILDKNGKLDRRKLSAIVFNNKEKLKRLEMLTHPAIMECALKRMNDFKISFCEVPLLFENGFEKYFDSVVVVKRRLADRISSVIERDNLCRNEVEMRIKSQTNYENANLSKYYVIHNNDKSIKELRQNVQNIIKDIENKIN